LRRETIASKASCSTAGLAEEFQADDRHMGARRGSARRRRSRACSPVLQDAIAAGRGTAHPSRLLCWLSAAGCQKLIGADLTKDSATGRPARACAPSRHPRARPALASPAGMPRIPAHRSASRAVLLLSDTPSIDANEDHGQGATSTSDLALERARRRLSARLYDATPERGRHRCQLTFQRSYGRRAQLTHVVGRPFGPASAH